VDRKHNKLLKNYKTAEIVQRLIVDGIVDVDTVKEFFEENQVDGKDLCELDDEGLEAFKQDLKVKNIICVNK
jgi:hypothetical protein